MEPQRATPSEMRMYGAYTTPDFALPFAEGFGVGNGPGGGA